MNHSLLPSCLSVAAVFSAVIISGSLINSASEKYVASSKLDHLATWCEAGQEHACSALSTATDGQCASPSGRGGCHYDSNTHSTTHSIRGAFH